MKATFTFIVLALCGNGYAGPCKPKSPTTTSLDGTSSIEATLSASIDLYSSITIETTTATSMTAELSSSAEVLTTTAESTTTTAEESGPSQLFLNPSFDLPNDNGDFDGSPWVLTDAVSPKSVRIDDTLGRKGSHSAYWSITSTAQDGKVYQRVDLKASRLYTLSYWWYVDESQQPDGLNECYIIVEQQGTDGLTSMFPSFQQLSTPLPLKSWTKREIVFNSASVIPANMMLEIVCVNSAGSGLKVALDDLSLSELV
ncbi:hypothetical protein ACHAPU_009565 [Fusarium lateritium]